MNLADYVINMEFECNGKVLEVNRAYELTGCEASDYTPNLQPNAQLDGAVLVNNNVEPREITVVATCTNKTRDFLVRFFNPKVDMKLTIKMLEVTRWITGRVSGFRFVQNRVNNRNAFEVSLMCENPYFKDMDSFGKNVANIVKQFAFPFISPIAPAQNADGTYHWIKGHISGYRQFNNKVNLDNVGDVPVGVTFRIEAKDTILNPRVDHESGAHIQVGWINKPLVMQKGDVLTIDTARGQKRIELNGENIFQFYERNSNMFELDVGANAIEYDAETGYTNMAVYVYYTPQYLGI